MNLNTQDPTRIEKQLFALVTLIGIAEAKRMLDKLRENLVAALASKQAPPERISKPKTAKKLAPKPEPVKKQVPKRRMKKRDPKNRPVAVVAKPKSLGPRMQAALKKELSAGPRQITKIVAVLFSLGLVPNTTTKSRRVVENYLHADKTFAVKSRGWYTLRSRAK